MNVDDSVTLSETGLRLQARHGAPGEVRPHAEVSDEVKWNADRERFERRHIVCRSREQRLLADLARPRHRRDRLAEVRRSERPRDARAVCTATHASVDSRVLSELADRVLITCRSRGGNGGAHDVARGTSAQHEPPQEPLAPSPARGRHQRSPGDRRALRRRHEPGTPSRHDRAKRAGRVRLRARRPRSCGAEADHGLRGRGQRHRLHAGQYGLVRDPGHRLQGQPRLPWCWPAAVAQGVRQGPRPQRLPG